MSAQRSAVLRATSIEWADRVWNPVTGCTKVRTHPDRLDAPLHLRKPSRVFVNSMSDLFHEDVPDEFIGSVLDRIETAEAHMFLVLTKRPERARRVLRKYDTSKHPIPRNLHLGVSVENQETADERIPILLDTPAVVRWVSAEPLLGPVRFDRIPHPLRHPKTKMTVCVKSLAAGIRWVVVGGESGPGARPCDIEWIRDIVGQCRDAGVPAFVKQLGSSPLYHDPYDLQGEET